jgi:hypothetical protein
LLDARPARAGVRLGGRLLPRVCCWCFSKPRSLTPHLYCRGPLFHPTSSSSRATPVLASVCVERRAAASSEHTRVRAQAARPLRRVVRRAVRPSSPDAPYCNTGIERRLRFQPTVCACQH